MVLTVLEELNSKVIHERKRANKRKQRSGSSDVSPQLQRANRSCEISELTGCRSDIELGRFQSRNHELFYSRERTKVVGEVVETRRLDPGPWSVIGEEDDAWIRRRDPSGV